MESFKFLDKSDAIYRYDVIEFKSTKNSRYYKIKILLKNKTLLYAREFSSKKERNYSYHWQNDNGDLIIRWDNAPYHREIKTYPHHRHRNNKIEESFEPSLYEVIQYIERIIIE